MCAASGHFRPFVTYHYHCTQGGKSSLDIVSLPQSHAESITRAAVLFLEAVGAFNTPKVRRSLDHDPVMVRFAYAPDMFRPPPPSQPRLDVDILGIAMKTGYRREVFLDKS